MTDTRLTRALLQLDPAPATPPDGAARRRAEARLQQIITSPLVETSPSQAPPRIRRAVRRAPVAALALAGAATLVISLGISQATPAYASWKPGPTAVTSAERDIATDACWGTRQSLHGRVFVAERRGDWVAVALAASRSAIATCLVQLPRGHTRARKVLEVAAGGYGRSQGEVPTGRQFFNTVVVHNGHPNLFNLGDAPTASFDIGVVGPSVAAVQIVTTDARVKATLNNGHFFAWWPGNAFAKGAKLSYRVTLTDGTVIQESSPSERH